MESLLQDIRYGYRMLIKNPGFAVIAVLTLALGIGVNTAIFTVVNHVVLQPLPFPGSDRLMVVWGVIPNFGHEPASLPDYVDWRDQNAVFENLAAYYTGNVNLVGVGEPERLIMSGATPNIFDTWQIKPVIGRFFTAEEGTPGGAKVAVLGYNLWQNRFAGDAGILGKTVTLNSTVTTVIGVAPPETSAVSQAQLFTPLQLNPQEMGRRADFLFVTGRLKPGVTRDQAQAEMSTIAGRLSQQYPNTNAGFTLEVVSLHEQIVGKVRPALIALWAAVGFVLLIVCANVANLLLARAAAREKELAIRAALGAGRHRILRQLLTESLLLAVSGGLFGILLAYWGLDALLAFAPSDLPRVAAVRIDGSVLLFAALVALGTGLIFGLLPSLQAARADVHDTLKEGGRSAHATGRHRLRRFLVVAEVAVSIVLLVGAGLMIRSIYRLNQVDPGFRAENILSFNLSLPGGRYQPRQAHGFIEQLTERLRALPGATAAVATSNFYLGGSNYLTFDMEGEPPPPPGDTPDAQVRSTTHDFHQVMGIPILQGRSFTAQDGERAPMVALVNQTFVKRYFGERDIVGRRISYSNTTVNGEQQPVWRAIVGIIGDVKQRGLDVEVYPEIVVPNAQAPSNGITVLVASERDPLLLASAAREQVRALDPALPIYSVEPVQQKLAESIAGRTFQMYLLGGFAALALLLASLGIYGVMAQAVIQRTPEFGVRMALGARPDDIRQLVLRYALRMTVFGVLAGAVGAVLLSRFLSTALYGVSATDPATFVGVVVLLGAVALVASYIPARRATRVDPMVALRYE